VVMEPDVVEIDLGDKGAEEWKDVDDLCGLRGKLGFVEIGGERGRRREIECEGDVLADVEASVVEMMRGDVGAEGVAGGAGGLGCGEGGVHVGANFGADWGGFVEVGVVTAGVEGSAHVEERLAGFEGDGRAAFFDLRGARAEGGIGAILRGVLGVADCGRVRRGGR